MKTCFKITNIKTTISISIQILILVVSSNNIRHANYWSYCITNVDINIYQRRIITLAITSSVNGDEEKYPKVKGPPKEVILKQFERVNFDILFMLSLYSFHSKALNKTENSYLI